MSEPLPPSDTLPADVATLVARYRELPLPRLVEALRSDQARRWRAGRRLLAEAYLDAFPTLAGSAEDALVLIWGEALLRLELGEPPQPAEYRARFPQHADALAAQFDLQRHLGPPVAPTLVSRELPEAALPASPALPGYEILGELGRGGMGVVYKARQVALDRLVALKVILAGEFAGGPERARLRSEALAVARLQHPNVVQIHEVGEHQGHPYLSLEYVEGGSLAGRLRGEPQPPRRAAELVETLARAVQAAHEKGVVHRDLKPANILLGADGTPKIADFGLAKRLDAQTAATQTGAVLGTPAYMAPEQAGGKTREVGPAVDVWALGVLLYECLTGRPPFQGPTPTDTILRVLSDEPPPPRQLNPAVPRDLETIALKCLRKVPQKRYASAAELGDDLRRFLQGEPIRARPLSLPERLWRRRRRLLAAGLALLLLALLGAGTLALLGWQRERRDRAFDEARARGLKQLESQNATEAVASFTEALRLHPDSSAALTDRGTAYGMLRDSDRALADFAEALRLNPDNALPYRRRGYLLLNLGRHEDAVADLTRSTDLDRHQALAWSLRADAYLKLGRWPEAANDLDTAIRLQPGDSAVHHRLSILHAAQGRWDDAVSDYESSGPPSLENSLVTRAAAALAGGDEAGYRQARDRLVALVEASGNDQATAAQAARVCGLPEKTEIDPARLLRLIEGAVKEIEGAVKELSDNPLRLRARPQVWYGVLFRLRVQALVWLRTGRAEDAVRQLEALLKYDPDYSPAIGHLLLSIALERLGRSEEAGRAFERAQRAAVPVTHVHETLEYQVLLREARKGRGQP